MRLPDSQPVSVMGSICLYLIVHIFLRFDIVKFTFGGLSGGNDEHDINHESMNDVGMLGEVGTQRYENIEKVKEDTLCVSLFIQCIAI